MIVVSYKKQIKVDEQKKVVICYNLQNESEMYQIECYIQDSDLSKETNHCLVKDFTKDREKAVKFVEMIANGEVFPVHVRDIMEDYDA